MKKEIGKRIRMLRENAGLNQLQLAAAIHVSRSTLSGYEIGRKIPNICILWSLADYFGVSLDYLVGRNQIEQEPLGAASELVIRD